VGAHRPARCRRLPVAALALAKRAYVIEMGRIIFSESDLLHDPRVRESYLGKVALG
jgi:ABC-type branched-subunit amino acid transport system ATPase component